MNLIFRIDANPEIGLGHLMRCLSLADYMRDHGHTSTFLSYNLTENYLSRCSNHHVHFLKDMKSIKNIDVKDDFLISKRFVDSLKPDWLVVDHYSLSNNWLLMMKAEFPSLKILVIDDTAQNNFSCDILLNQNYGFRVQDYEYNYANCSKYLMGSEYALLRPEFNRNIEDAKKIRADSKLRDTFLVSTGGTYNEKLNLIIFKALSQLPEKPKIQFLSPFDLRNKEIFKDILTLNLNLELIEQKDFLKSMLSSSIYIGAGGSINWERSCLGLPGIVFSMAENQSRIIEKLEDQGSVIDLGYYNSIKEVKVIDSIEKVRNDKLFYSKMVKASFAVTEGKGAELVTKELERINYEKG